MKINDRNNKETEINEETPKNRDKNTEKCEETQENKDKKITKDQNNESKLTQSNNDKQILENSENSKTQIIVTSVFENIPLKLKAPNRPSSVLVPSYTKPFHRRTISEFERLRMMLNRTQSPKHNIR